MSSIISDYRPGAEGLPPRTGSGAHARLKQKMSVASGLTLTLNTITLAFAIGMIVLMFFIWASIRDVASIEGRLSQLPEFEGRLSSQMDTLGAGVHAQFEELNRQISTLMEHAQLLQEQAENLASENRDLVERIRGLEGARDTTLAAVPAAEEEAIEKVLKAPVAQPQAPRPKQQPQTSSVQFEKSVSPDGKVTYSKVR